MWISVKDKLPKRNEYVLIYDGCGLQYVGALLYDHDEFEYSSCCSCSVRLDDITHWMPLPEPPENVGENNGL